MKLRKLDQILEQCLQETDLKENNMFNADKLQKLCEDALEETSLETMVKNTINDLITDYNPIKEDFWTQDTLEQIEEPLAENLGYKVYGEDGDNALVIDVKGRPDITNEEVLNLLNEDENALQLAIQDFAQVLDEQIPNFTIRGRMGGYWGIADLDHNIVITERGKQLMVDKLMELAKNNEADTYEGTLADAEAEDRIEGFLYDLCDNYKDDIYDTLLHDNEAFAIDPKFLALMKDLEESIDSQEKAWNDLQSWEYLTEE